MKQRKPKCIYIAPNPDRFMLHKIRLSRRVKRWPIVLDRNEVFVVAEGDNSAFYVFELQPWGFGTIN